MKTLGIGSVVALALAALACGKPAPDASSTLKVTGSIDTQRQALDNASAVAIGSDGRTFSAYLKQNGKFTLELPVGHVYRIIIANSTARGELRPIGHLVNSTSRGKADVIAVKNGGSINLGTLRRAGSSSNTLKTACDCEGGEKSSDSDKSGYDEKSGGGYDEKTGDKSGGYDEKTGDKSGGYDEKTGEKGESDKDSDYKCKQKNEDKDRVCQSETDVELEADNEPGDKCAADEDDEDAPKPTKKSCSTKDEDKDGKDDDDGKSGSGEKGTGGYDEKTGGYDEKSGGDTGTDGKSGGGTDEKQASCTCSKECGSGSSCVASKCTGTPAPSGTPTK